MPVGQPVLETVTNTYIYIYMGSSSVLVLIGSHSLCNSFVVNQFLFFHTKWRKFPLLYTQYGGKKEVLFIFYQQNILPCHAKMAAKNGNGDTLLLVLEATSYQTKIFRHISNLFAKLQHAKVPES